MTEPQPRHRTMRLMTARKKVLLIGAGAVAMAVPTLATGTPWANRVAEARMEVPAEPEQHPPQLLARTVVLAPVHPLSRPTNLSSPNLNEVEWPEDKIPEGAFRQGELPDQAYTRSELPAGLPLAREQVSPSPDNIAALIKPGYRAATLKVDSTSGVEGWAAPGTHVDVVLTYRNPADGRKKSQIIVENAVVLSYDRRTERTDPDPLKLRGPFKAPVTTATLLVPVLDAVKLHTARAIGVVGLVLRSAGDEGLVGPLLVTPDDLTRKVS